MLLITLWVSNSLKVIVLDCTVKASSEEILIFPYIAIPLVPPNELNHKISQSTARCTWEDEQAKNTAGYPSCIKDKKSDVANTSQPLPNLGVMAMLFSFLLFYMIN